jgi:hypothetical protein
MSEEDFDGYLFQAMPVRGVLKGTVQPGDRRVSLRAVADLASALEKVQTLCYQALNDTTSERIKRKDDGETDVSATEMHAKIAAALSKVAADDSLPAKVFDGELAGAQERVATFAALRAQNPDIK